MKKDLLHTSTALEQPPVAGTPIRASLDPSRLIDRPIWAGIHLLVVVGLLLRLASALLSERINWYDEIYQYLEQAHRLVYGYGTVTWEYRYGIRNWLVPGVLAGVLEVLRQLGAETPAQYAPAVRVVFAVLSLSAVYAIYLFARDVYSERVARLSAVLVACWYEMVYVSTIGTPEVFATYLLVVALALGVRPTTRRMVVCGLLLGLAVALRMHYAPFAITLLGWIALGGGRARAALAAACAAGPVVAAGLLDAWTWGVPFSSFVLATKYNVLYGVSELFGVRSPFYFGWALIVASLGMYGMAGVVGCIALRRNLLLLLIASVVLPHSLLGHKEYRFITLALPLLLVLLAYAISLEWLGALRSAAPVAAGGGVAPTGDRLRPSSATLLVTAAVVSALGMAYALPRQRAAYPNGAFDRNPTFLAQLDLSRREGVRAVAILHEPWYEAGGFNYLHRDVPLYDRDDFRRHGVALADAVTHALARVGDPVPDGFVERARYGDVVVYVAVDPHRPVRPVPVDTRNRRLAEVEDRFVPEVSPRFPGRPDRGVDRLP